jgi:hypothetical protein
LWFASPLFNRHELDAAPSLDKSGGDDQCTYRTLFTVRILASDRRI